MNRQEHRGRGIGTGGRTAMIGPFGWVLVPTFVLAAALLDSANMQSLIDAHNANGGCRSV